MVVTLQLLSAYAAIALLTFISIFMVCRRQISQAEPIEMKPENVDLITKSHEHNRLSQTLASALPGSVILPQDAAAFKQSMNVYWAQQER